MRGWKAVTTMIERACPVCGKVYMVNAERLAKHGRGIACSKACSYQWRAQRARKRTEVACAVCGTILHYTASKLALPKHGAVFCSRACHYKGRSLGLSKRVVTKPYTYTPEGRARLLANARKPKGKRVHHFLTCLNCGEVFDDKNWGRPRRSGMTFCSLACCNAYRKGRNNPSWRGGYPGYYGPNWRTLRRAAWERDGYACRRCGKTREEMGRRPDVHHIAPVGTFADPDEANTINNLICTCHACHMYIEWHGFDFEINQDCVLIDVPKLRRQRIQRRCHDPIPCACGCGAMMDPYGGGGHRRQYLRNHQNRGRERSGL